MGVVLQETRSSIFRYGRISGWAAPMRRRKPSPRFAKAAGLHEFITSLPLGYGALAGEHGVRFLPRATATAGSLARAILRDPEVLLLDEATSALDPIEEAAVNQPLRILARGRTVISATHRLSTAADADHIFVFDEGRIVEQGSHFELLAATGYMRTSGASRPVLRSRPTAGMWMSMCSA